MAKLKTIVLAVTGASALSGAALSHAGTPNQIGMAMMRLNSSLIDQGNAYFASGSLWNALRRNFGMTEVNPELVRSQEYRLSSNSAYFNRTIERSKPYIFHIANEVKKRNMPSEIALLPFIESAFVTKARSHVGASGLWQFMPSTGRHYGLEKTALYDGRHDIYASTNAALDYLQYLYSLFGDWSLTLAAYNWGEGNVGRAVNRARAQGLEPIYENLRMPNETRNYVPKLLAVRNIVSNPQMFNVHLSDIDNKPYFKTVTINKPADISALARLAGISESEFLTLNPAFNGPVFLPKENRKLLLPTSVASSFERNYRNAKPESLLSWDVYTPYTTTSISSIAAQTGMSVGEIKRLNGMNGSNVSAGRSILVAKNSVNSNGNLTGGLGQESLNFASIDNDTTPDVYHPDVEAITPLPASRPNSFAAANTPTAQQPIQIQTIARSNRIDPLSVSVAKLQPSTRPYSSQPGIVPPQTRPITVAQLAPAKPITPITPIASSHADSVIKVEVIKPASTLATAQPTPAIKPIALTSATQTTVKPVTLASTTQPTIKPEPITLAEDSPVAKLISLRNAQSSAHVASLSSKPAAATTTPVTLVATSSASSPAKPAALVALTESKPLPQAPAQTSGSTDGSDPLLALAQQSSLQLNAAESVRNSLAESNTNDSADDVASEITAHPRSTQAVATRAKQQQRVETRLARSDSAPVGTHRVTDGDTLFNISQRYNVSVSDLIVANHISGNNIKKGQLLKVAAISGSGHSNQSAVRNVAYTVRNGDTLNTIANRFKVDVNDIRRWNHNARTLVPGQRINLQGS